MDVGAILQQYGLAGLIIFVLAGVVLFLYKENQALIKQLFQAQESRRQDALETSKELNQTLQTFSQSTQLLVDKIQIVQRTQ